MRALHPYFLDEHPAKLDEQSYKQIVRDITKNNIPGEILHNLPHRDWAPLIKYVKYHGHDQGIFRFFVPNKYNGWFTYIQFEEWDNTIFDHDLTAPEVSRLLLWAGNIRVHCPCPAFKFWGHQYIMTQKDSAIIPEIRYPHIRNPQLRGGCCKHLNRTIKVLPFHLGFMAHEVKQARADSAVEVEPK
jgi:hypothetical protein